MSCPTKKDDAPGNPEAIHRYSKKTKKRLSRKANSTRVMKATSTALRAVALRAGTSMSWVMVIEDRHHPEGVHQGKKGGEGQEKKR